ncbi:hypothetical protein FAF44_38295 [Nonomuraea sp. MG754425]|uniref:hypothetical protein n=1 Tax=Nonomuraea sp. MG754425 TaxID=2570319 RepID=UPI001F47BE36|nr:hypothetical protein [Nonomuraea sp. MG754425]MCF6474189.1 hypothetical protein [Nonomuraea sp. MG754425]
MSMELRGVTDVEALEAIEAERRPGLDSVTRHEELVWLLAEQFVRADVSLRELQARADKAGGTRLPRATCADMLAGRRFPKKAVMVAFLRGCRVPEHRLPEWEHAWERVRVARLAALAAQAQAQAQAQMNALAMAFPPQAAPPSTHDQAPPPTHDRTPAPTHDQVPAQPVIPAQGPAPTQPTTAPPNQAPAPAPVMQAVPAPAPAAVTPATTSAPPPTTSATIAPATAADHAGIAPAQPDTIPVAPPPLPLAVTAQPVPPGPAAHPEAVSPTAQPEAPTLAGQPVPPSAASAQPEAAGVVAWLATPAVLARTAGAVADGPQGRNRHGDEYGSRYQTGSEGDGGWGRSRKAYAVAITASLAAATALGVLVGARMPRQSQTGAEPPGRALVDDGRAFGPGGSSRFTVTVDPANTGVRLIRRLDAGIGMQHAAITVDGAPAGAWRPLPMQHTHRWQDQSVDLPPSLSAGRTSLTVVNTFVSSGQDFNEFRYVVKQRIDGVWSITGTLDVGPQHLESEAAHDYRITGPQTFAGVQEFSYPPHASPGSG